MPVAGIFKYLFYLGVAHAAVHGNGRNIAPAQMPDLVLHQRYQRCHHQAGAPARQRWHLVANGFAATRWQ